jgi:hypothetical protein
MMDKHWASLPTLARWRRVVGAALKMEAEPLT